MPDVLHQRRDRHRPFKKLAGPLAAGAIVAGILKIGNEFSNLASTAEEVDSKFEAVFKNQTREVDAWAREFSSNIGRSVVDTKSFLSTIQDTFVPLGFARDAAADMSTTVVTLATDLASFNDLNTADVVRDLQSALVGNTETLRKFGVVANEAAIKQEAINSGIWDGEEALTAQQKAQAI